MIAVEWEAAKAHSYDLVVAVCGYESRATFVLDQLSNTQGDILALDYRCTDTFNYNENRKYFSALPNTHWLEIVRPSFERDILAWLSNWKNEADLKPDEILEVLFDLSSCSRSIIAAVLMAFSKALGDSALLTCTYALSAFDNVPTGELPSHISEPVVGELSGWSDDLSKPPCAVIGLGFEPGRALGCLDYLEIPEVRLFVPQGPDPRFEDAVKVANRALITEAGSDTILPYNVLQPVDTYEKLESLVFGVLSSYRPILIPLGPKIFAALSIVLAIRALPKICVWRTSSGNANEIGDRHASGDVSVFSTSFHAWNRRQAAS